MAEIKLDKAVQLLEIEENDLKFQVPASICVTGPSQSGKSHWIVKLIKNREKMFPIHFHEILYCIPEHLGMTPNPIFQKIKESFPTAQLVSGLPDVTKLNLNFDETPKLLVIDDLMTEFLGSYAMVKLLSIEVHHYNITTVFTLHNLFAPSKFGRTICRNINYKVLFQNRLDLRECRNVSLQICNQPNFLSESFEFLNQEYPDEPSYIVIDGHIRYKHKKLFVRGQIFPDSNGKIEPIYFFPKNQA
jgi:hypothetical protein